MSLETKHFYEFKNFRLDPAERVLFRDGKPLPLTPKAFHMLMILVENHGHIVDKEKLMGEIWADSFVEEGNLSVNARRLRKALADDANEPKFIETIPRRGYRFIADVEENFEDIGARARLNGSIRPSLPETKSKLYLPVAALLVLATGSIALVAWYSGSSSSASSAPILSAPFRSTKFSNSGNVVHAVMSPDGKFVAFSDETGGKQSVWLRQLETSENIQIVPPSDVTYFGLAYSHDGNSLYFVRRDQPETALAHIYRVSAFGGIPVKVVEKAEGWTSISPDGNEISFVRCNYEEDDFCSLMIAGTDGKSERRLLTEKRPMRIGPNQFSLDGKSVAFAVGQSWNGGSDFRLRLIDVASGAQTEISPKTFFNIRGLRWLPDGSSLLFTADENTDRRTRIWQVSSATGVTRSLTNDATKYSNISLNKNADKMIATQVTNDFKLYVLPTGERNDPRPLTAAGNFDFAPGGKLVYSTDDLDIWTINLDGTGQRQLTNDALGDDEPKVSPDGRYIFFTSNRTGSNQVWRMNADGSDQTQLTKKEGGYPQFTSQDGQWVYFRSGLYQNLWQVSADGGEETRVSGTVYESISPDGKLAAYPFRDKKDGGQVKIVVISLEDQKIVKTFGLAEGELFVFRAGWGDDSRTIWYVTATPPSPVESGPKYSIWKRSLNEDKPGLIADIGGGEIEDAAFSPDRKQFAFIRGRWIHDAVLITGFGAGR